MLTQDEEFYITQSRALTQRICDLSGSNPQPHIRNLMVGISGFMLMQTSHGRRVGEHYHELLNVLATGHDMGFEKFRESVFLIRDDMDEVDPALWPSFQRLIFSVGDCCE